MDKDQFYQISSSLQNLGISRRPKTAPKVVAAQRNVQLQGPSTTVNQSVCTNVPETSDSSQVQPPQRRALNTQHKEQPSYYNDKRYIPGLSHHLKSPPKTENDDEGEKVVPDALIEGFLDGSKNPISTLMEYSVIQKLIIVFEEVGVEKPSIVARFASRVKVNGKPFPQGTGCTKKEAKTAAAKIVMTMLLGLDTDDVCSKDDEGNVLLDSFGRKIVVRDKKPDGEEVDDNMSDNMSLASSTISTKMDRLRKRNFAPKVDLPTIAETGVRPIWDPPKHPVSKLNEYCSKNDFKLDFKVSPKPLEIGFKAEVYINETYIDTGYASTKKDAKKIVAEKALQKFAPNQAAEVANYKAFNPSKVALSLHNDKAKVVRDGSIDYKPPPPPIEETTTLPKSELELLQDACRTHRLCMEVVVTEYPDMDGIYEAHVTLDGTVIALEEGESKKEARRNVAREALKEIEKQTAKKPEIPYASLSFHDRIQALALDTFEKLLAPIKENPALHKYIAAFIISQGASDMGKVVAIGTGNTLIPGNTRETDGRQIYDLHAVVIARRALMKYLYKQIKQYFEGDPMTILEPKPGTALLTFKANVCIRLYLSRAPCGDAILLVNSIQPPKNDSGKDQAMHYPQFPTAESGFTSSKFNQGFAVLLASAQSPVEPGSMSCSDKLLKWNVVGLQGALFSHYLAPIYLTSLTIGCLFDHGHVTRAICCRLSPDIAQYLPKDFRVTHPYIGQVTKPDSRFASTDIAPDSINWSYGDEKVEILSCHTGKCTERSPFKANIKGSSRLSKAGFLYRFRDIARLTNQPSLFELRTYLEAKQLSTEYQDAKETLKEHIQLTGFGFWTNKPPEFEGFITK